MNSFKNPSIEPSFKIPTSPGNSERVENTEKILSIIELAEVSIKNNLNSINESVAEIINDNNVKSESKSFLLYLIASLSYLQDDLIIFDDYVNRMTTAKYLTVDNTKYINNLRVLLLNKSEKYLEGLSFVDNLLSPLS